MGAGASSAPEPAVTSVEIPNGIDIKSLPDAIEEAVFVREKFPLIIDPTGKAKLFLKYQLGSFVKHSEISQTNLNRSLVGALIHGKTLTVSFEDLNGVTDSIFQDGYFPKEVLNRSELFKDELWQTLLKPEEGDPPANEVIVSPEFVFILITNTDYIPPDVANYMQLIKVVDKESTGGHDSNTSEMEQIAGLYGATEIIRFGSTRKTW